LDEGDYADLPTAAIFRALKELDAKGRAVDFSTLGALTEDDPVAADLVPLVLMHEPERAEGEATDAFLEEAESCLMTLRLMSYDRRIKELAPRSRRPTAPGRRAPRPTHHGRLRTEETAHGPAPERRQRDTLILNRPNRRDSAGRHSFPFEQPRGGQER
jgi:hypothetical protein